MVSRQFAEEFKFDAVKLVTGRGVAVAQAARDLDLAESVLRRWMREASSAPVTAFPGCRVALNWALPHFVWSNGSILARNNSGPARPYMARLRVFRRLI